MEEDHEPSAPSSADRPGSKKGKQLDNSRGKSGPRGPRISSHPEVAEEEEYEEEEEGYDIDE